MSTPDTPARTSFLSVLLFASALMPAGTLLANDSSDAKAIEQAYEPTIRPLLARYCHKCHSGDRTEADIDLASFETIGAIRKDPRTWIKVDEMLDSRQMPPRKARQPTDAERSRLQRWVRGHLAHEAEAHAGDPGAVVLRRLSNSEYTYTVRDLTGLDGLDPTREFPVDGAAGEGFTNTGSALVMSPSLVTKYLDAAKEIAGHAVLLPDGIRFSPHRTRRDWTDVGIARIQEFYRGRSVATGSSKVNLQGIRFDTNRGGRLDVEPFFAATLSQRDALASGEKTIDSVARDSNLSARYLETLWRTLTSNPQTRSQSVLLERVRTLWKAAKPDGAGFLAAEVGRWQEALWKFNAIGHIDREGGPESWMEGVSPITARQEFKIALPTSPAGGEISLYLSASDAGDGNDGDIVIWKNARLVGDGRPDQPLRDTAGLNERTKELRHEVLRSTAKYLAAVAEATPQPDVAALAAKHGVKPELLEGFLNFLEIGEPRPATVEGHFTETRQNAANYDFVKGWGTPATPSIFANSSAQEVRIPGIARPHSVFVHPSPTLFSAVGWQSPVDSVVRVEARLSDVHPECGNGVEWVLDYRSGKKVTRLWRGDFSAGGSAKMEPRTIAVRRGELLAFHIGPRGGNHSCDLTEVHLVITETGNGRRVWDLAKDVSGNILAGNPHADGHGNKTTWHFFKDEMAALLAEKTQSLGVPGGSLLAKWRAEKNPARRRDLAGRVQTLAAGKPPADASSPDAVLFDQLHAMVTGMDGGGLLENVEPDKRFGKHPLGHPADSLDLVVQAPSVVEIRVPSLQAKGRELLVSGLLDPQHGREGSVQLEVSLKKPAVASLSSTASFVINDGSRARRRVETAFDDFRRLFPDALCYSRIVPVDEVVTLTLFHREDDQLKRLMLDDEQSTHLDRLWDELLFISQEPLVKVNAFEQISEFATQDRPDLVKAFKPLGPKINARADTFRRRLVDTEPAHLKSVLDFADRAWRRPLTAAEKESLRGLYRRMRGGEIPHDESIRLTLARVLTSPSFLYRLERPGPGAEATPVSDRELASRLSYFLWSSTPDEELHRVAEAGELTDTGTLRKQARRMLKDHRTRRLAILFACQWLHVRDFDENDEKNEKLYPGFAKMRGAMYEETVRFFEDMFRNDGSILSVLDADHTFLDESLAKHYGIDGVLGDEWRRVDGVRAKQRGGVLGMATVLAAQSGASRTSPILRGNWVSETLLGERLPRPPPNVPQLPGTVPPDLTARELIERHSSVPACAKCHAKIDPYGFALEQFDAVGRIRPEKVDTRTKLVDGKLIDGIDGLRQYLLTDRRDEIVEQFCRKLLGYALGRAVQLTDRPLLADMKRQLEKSGYRFNVALEKIITSRQFRQIRGQATTSEN